MSSRIANEWDIERVLDEGRPGDWFYCQSRYSHRTQKLRLEMTRVNRDDLTEYLFKDFSNREFVFTAQQLMFAVPVQYGLAKEK